MLAALAGNFGCPSGYAQSILASTGRTWHKLSVPKDGIYKVDYSFLRNVGFNPDGQNPAKVQIFASPIFGMLPQPNSPRNGDLVEVPIHMVDGGDGKLNPGDYFLFFGKGPDTWGVDPVSGKAYYENHLYADENFYYLSVGSTSGLRVPVVDDQGGSFPLVEEYDDIGYYESELTNVLHSGRKWYGETFGSTLEYTVRFEMSGVLDGSTLTLHTGVMGQTLAPASFQFFINGMQVASQPVPVITTDPYTIVGADVQGTIPVNASAVLAPTRTNQDIKVHFTKASGVSSVGYLDYLVLHAKRVLAHTGSQTIFRSLKSLDQPVTRYGILQAPSDGMVWDITNTQSVIYRYTTSAGLSQFTAPSASLNTYIIVSNQNYLIPAYTGTVPVQNLRGIGPTDFLIIAAPEFQSEAQRFAAYRRSHDGLNVFVVTTQQVYNEFSGGKQDVTALRDYIKFVFDKGSGLKNVLLFGRGSYDYKDQLSFNKNFVPIYQSRNSLDPLETYASDDFYGFLENTEGNWGEDPAEPHTLDVGIGRVPVKRLEEATAWIDKVIAYENDNYGPWRKRILFTADDGDLNLHNNHAELLALALETGHPEVDVQKVYLDYYPQGQNQSGPISTDARNALTRAVNTGVGIINFTGHGSELQWMQERVVDQVSFDEWKPGKKFPFLVTATCEFGRTDDPGLISSAELALFRAHSGAIGLVTTSRPVYSSTNFTLNNAFHQSLFTRVNGMFQDWGFIFRQTKNNSMSGVGNRNFSLLGDPSMMPPLGSDKVIIDEVTNLTSGSDTLKAMSNVLVRGHIESQGAPNNQFEGHAQVTLYDKLSAHVTLGNENTPFNFVARDNVLFRGQANVQGGEFEMDFILPSGMDPVVGSGRVGAYASSNSLNRDALGALAAVKTGSTEPDPGVDDNGPGIELFMGDTTFVSGGLTGSSSRIVAILSDESGIDISAFIPSNDLQVVLDDTLIINLNDFYQTDPGTVARGKVDYPIDGLLPGAHQMTMYATDVYGNTSQGSIAFTVTDAPGIRIDQWLNYPNPFQLSTVFHFTHNRPGEDLEAAVTIFDRMGKVVLYNTYQIVSSTYKVDLPPWDGTSADGNKLSEGLYLMKLTLRSLLDGTKNERIAKVILLN